MKLKIEQHEFKEQFTFYEDQLCSKQEELKEVYFLDENNNPVEVYAIGLSFGKKDNNDNTECST